MSKYTNSIFISFEGGEGSGKSTQAQLLDEFLRNQNYNSRLVHEPGGTEYGNGLRKLLLDLKTSGDEQVSQDAQVLGFNSARAQLVNNVIKPRLAMQNTITISDRFSDSTLAYQVFGNQKEEDLADVKAIIAFAVRGVVPNATFLIDVRVETGLARIEGRLKKDEEKDYLYDNNGQQLTYIDAPTYFDAKDVSFHNRVRDGYRWLIGEDPNRWRTIDGEQSVANVFEAVKNEIELIIKQRGIRKKKSNKGKQ